MTTPLERLKQDLEDGSEPEPWTLVKKRDLSLALAVVDAAKECADELAAELEDKYGKTRDYPSEQRRYERDMKPVGTVRKALSALTEDTK